MRELIEHYEVIVKQKDEVIEAQSNLLESYDNTVIAAIEEVRKTMEAMRQYINLDLKKEDTWISGREAAKLMGITYNTLIKHRDSWKRYGRLKLDFSNPSRVRYSRLDCINFNKATL